MASSSATTTASVYKKRWEGVHATTKLRTLAESCWKQAQVSSSTSIKTAKTEDSTQDLSVSSRANALEEAKSILSNYHSQSDEEKETMSIQVLRAIDLVLQSSQDTTTTTASNALEEALKSTELAFTPPPPSLKLTEEQKRFRRRMERLRLKSEETSYHRLTKNIESAVPDDVTTRSMTYAASVGLNMIVAPLSFGCFTYFFAGQIFSWISSPEQNLRRNANPTPDIRRVIAGVVGGVAMLFIEMILFVIRTHEFDKSIRQKDKRKTTSPFNPAVPVATKEVEMTKIQRKS